MALMELNLKPSRKELRWFAGLWFPALCAMLGTVLLRKWNAPVGAISIWSLGAVISVAGLLHTAIIRPIYIGLMYLTFPIGWVMSHLVLLLTYFAVLTPVGALVRCFHDPMERTFDRAAKSYWLPREAPEKKRYFRQL